MRSVIIIPSRYESTRFPGKPLAMIAGKSLIQRVWERAVLSKKADEVFVATDDERIASHVDSFDGNPIMTSASHTSGTDRIAEAISLIDSDDSRIEVIVNLQGDEPLVDIDDVDRLIDSLSTGEIDVVTLSCPLSSGEEINDPDVVKVVTAEDGRALYFSRAPIPWDSPSLARRHIGIYGFRRDALQAFSRLAPSSLEIAERLEQLRLLQNGYTIRVVQTSRPHLGVDRPEDVPKIESLLA